MKIVLARRLILFFDNSLFHLIIVLIGLLFE